MFFSTKEVDQLDVVFLKRGRKFKPYFTLYASVVSDYRSKDER